MDKKRRRKEGVYKRLRERKRKWKDENGNIMIKKIKGEKIYKKGNIGKKGVVKSEIVKSGTEKIRKRIKKE